MHVCMRVFVSNIIHRHNLERDFGRDLIDEPETMLFFKDTYILINIYEHASICMILERKT